MAPHRLLARRRNDRKKVLGRRFDKPGHGLAPCTIAPEGSSCETRDVPKPGSRIRSRHLKGATPTMKRISILLLLIAALCSQNASAQLLTGLLGGAPPSASAAVSGSQGGVIVRTSLGELGLTLTCLLEGCTVVRSLDGDIKQVFLVRPATGLLPELLAGTLKLVTGILNVEVDRPLSIPRNAANLTTVPPGLFDQTPINYYGSTVWNGYANQPAAQIIGVTNARSAFRVSGAGVVADIDTGVDPNHPALKGVLLAGYDFTRNQAGGSEMTDVAGYKVSPCSSCPSGFVTQSSVALLDQSSV